MSFDEINKVISDVEKSQSLSSRAMSFDENAVDSVGVWSVSIPFEQGDVFRLRSLLSTTVTATESQSLSSRAMSFD